MQSIDRRICFFVPTFEEGGAERVMVMLANGFAGEGHEVDFLVISSMGTYRGLLDPRVRLINLGVKRVLRSLPHLVRYFQREKPSTIVSTLYYASAVALLARSLSRVPARIYVRVENTLSERMTETRSIKSRILILAARVLFPTADGIIAVSKGVADDSVRFLKLDPRRVHTIYNPSFPDNIDALANEPMEDLLFDPGTPIVLAVGALRRSKDHQTLLRAFRIVKERHQARLVILGEGEERVFLESLIRDLDLAGCVHMPGFVANPFKYMKQASVFVLSSRYEGLPSSLIQAMRCGCAVVSTDCHSGPTEILDLGRFGSLVPVGDAEALAGAIIRSLGQPTDRRALVARANTFGSERALMAYHALLCPEWNVLSRQ